MSYVGKLIVSKGVDLLLAAWPLVVAQVPDARLVRRGLRHLPRRARRRWWRRSRRGTWGPLREIAARGRELEGGPAGELAYLAAFLDGLEGEPARGLSGAPRRRRPSGSSSPAASSTSDLPGLLPACEAQVVPSTFPEAFGMVAAEAAACGALPLSAAHSGLAEVTATLAEALEPDLRDLLSFERGPGAVEAIAERAGALAVAARRASASGRPPPWPSWRGGPTAGRAWPRG